MTDRSRLGPQQRRAAWEALASTRFDLVVVGGGVTGCGAALDAVTRGLTVALVEASDLAAGTSSRSGKIFHGGLRYLERLDFSLVREALVERDLMVARLCPHLVSPEPFLVPFRRRRERPYVGAGVALYDLLRLTGPRSVRGHRHLTRRGALREIPGLRPDITGAVRYYDVRVDDARHTLTLARTAASYGAVVATRAPVVGLLTRDGRVRGVRVRDAETGREVEVEAAAVVNATGVWARQVQELAGPASVEVTPAKGVHLVVPGHRIDARSGLVARAGDSVFIIRRWFDHWLLGTTDTRWDFSCDEPVATGADVDFLLGQANRWLRFPLGRDDLVGVYAGLRPLVSGRGPSTAAFSRDYAVLPGPPGLVTVVGGKYTTYRLMARDAVAAAVAAAGMTAVPASLTADLPLWGAAGFAAVARQRARLAAECGLPPERVGRLLGRYGAGVGEVLDLLTDEPALACPLPGAPGYLAAEVVYAARAEGARHVDDVLLRRTRAFMETPDRGRRAAPEVGRLLAAELGWDDARRQEEVARYLARTDAEARAALAPSDAQAVAAMAAATRRS